MMEMAGGGEAVPREPRWRKCLHSTFRCTTQSGEIVPVGFSYFDCVVREQSAEYFYGFCFLPRRACVAAACARVSLCLPALCSASG